MHLQSNSSFELSGRMESESWSGLEVDGQIWVSISENTAPITVVTVLPMAKWRLHSTLARKTLPQPLWPVPGSLMSCTSAIESGDLQLRKGPLIPPLENGSAVTIEIEVEPPVLRLQMMRQTAHGLLLQYHPSLRVIQYERPPYLRSLAQTALRKQKWKRSRMTLSTDKMASCRNPHHHPGQAQCMRQE